MISRYADGEVELVGQYATRFPINVIVDMLGLPKADHEHFHRWYTSIMGFLSNLAGDEQVTADGLRTKAEFEEYLIPVVRRRRAEPGDDLLSTLCSAEIDGVRMSDEEIKAFCSLLLTAGGETTDKAIASTMTNLVRHPDQLQAVRADHGLIAAAFAETLRHSPPVHMIMRQPAEDVELSGGVVAAGKTVTCLIGAANRDPQHYTDPDAFDIHRADLDLARAYTAGANHTAFALGRHFCVGAMLARTELETGIAQLLDAMDDIRFTDGAPPPEHGVFTRAPAEVRLTSPPSPGADMASNRPSIENTLHRAAWGYDENDVDLIAAQFTEDASMTLQIGRDGDPIGPFDGRDAIRKLHADSLAAQTDQRRHNVSNLIVESETDDSASTLSNLTLLSIENGAARVLSSGWYRDELVRHGEAWLIRTRHIYLDLPY